MKKFQEACEELLSEEQDYVTELFNLLKKTVTNWGHKELEDVYVMHTGIGSKNKMLRVEFKNGQVMDTILRNKKDE